MEKKSDDAAHTQNLLTELSESKPTMETRWVESQTTKSGGEHGLKIPRLDGTKG